MVRAVDRDIGSNGQVKYSLRGSSADLFDIDHFSGEITVSDNGTWKLDREIQPIIELEVFAPFLLFCIVITDCVCYKYQIIT